MWETVSLSYHFTDRIEQLRSLIRNRINSKEYLHATWIQIGEYTLRYFPFG